MGTHDTVSGAQPDQPQVLEAKARLHDIEEYEAADAIDKAFWLNDTAKSAVGLLYLYNCKTPELLLDGTITVQREGDYMVARMTPTTA